MKYTLSLLLLSFLIISCAPKELPTVSMVDENGFFLKISHQTSKQELKDFQSKVSKIHGVNFDFSKTEFTEANLVKNLNAQLSKAAFKAKCSADLFTLQYKYYGFDFAVENGQVTTGKTGFIE